MRTNSEKGPAKGVALERLKKTFFLKGFDKKPSILGSAWILKNRAPAASYLQAVRAASSFASAGSFLGAALQFCSDRAARH